MDEEGYLYFVARHDHIIRCKGEKTATKEVETVLYGLEGVVEAAVIGVPDPILGQAIKAFVVTDRVEVTEAHASGHCRAHLENLMVPNYVEFCFELAKRSSGKIKKTDLK